VKHQLPLQASDSASTDLSFHTFRNFVSEITLTLSDLVTSGLLYRHNTELSTYCIFVTSTLNSSQRLSPRYTVIVLGDYSFVMLRDNASVANADYLNTYDLLNLTLVTCRSLSSSRDMTGEQQHQTLLFSHNCSYKSQKSERLAIDNHAAVYSQRTSDVVTNIPLIRAHHASYTNRSTARASLLFVGLESISPGFRLAPSSDGCANQISAQLSAVGDHVDAPKQTGIYFVTSITRLT